MNHKHYANDSPNFYSRSKVWNFASIFDTSRVWRAVVSKRNMRISAILNISLQRGLIFVLTQTIRQAVPNFNGGGQIGRNLASFWPSRNCRSEMKQYTWHPTQTMRASTTGIGLPISEKLWRLCRYANICIEKMCSISQPAHRSRAKSISEIRS